MRLSTFARSNDRLFTLVTFIGLSLQGFVPAQSGPPPILLDAGNGQTAELTNYSLTNFEQTPSGGYRGDFCFTLRNTSITSAPRLPIYLTGAGFLPFTNSGTGVPDARASSYPATFIEVFNPEVNELQLDVLVAARNASENGGNFLVDGPTDGIAAGDAVEFCFSVSLPAAFGVDELLRNLVIVFSDEVSACYGSKANSAEQVVRRSNAILRVLRFGSSNITLELTAYSGPRTLTAVGFNIENGSTAFALGTDPVPILGPLSFSSDLGRLRQSPLRGKDEFEFGLISDSDILSPAPGSGLQVGEELPFSITGDFVGETTGSILKNAVPRFEDRWATLGTGCETLIPSVPGIRGAVATVPR